MTSIFAEVAASAERNIAERARRVGQYEAEYVLGHELSWHVVCTQPNRENTAAAHLAARRFGIYIPELGIRRQHGRQVISHSERMFSGYVFVLVSGIEHQRRKIEACPGVTGILRHASGNAVQLDDIDVRYIMSLEAKSLTSGILCGRPRRRRRNHAIALPPDNPDIPEGTIRMSCKSYWDALPNIDNAERNMIFRKALGLD